MTTINELTTTVQGCVGASDFGGRYELLFVDGAKRDATKAEIDAAIAAAQIKEAQKVESDAARDDAKRALAALDTIITGIDGATLTQAKTAIKQLAQIQKHIILATLGR